MTLWKIAVVGLGLLTLRRMIKGFPSWDVPLSDGRVIHVLQARHERHALIDRTNDPHGAHGDRFNVTFDGDWMSPAERIAAMPELAAWAATLPESRDCGRMFVTAAVRVVNRRFWRSYRHAEWRQFRRLADGGLELLNQGKFGQRIYQGKQTDRSRPND